MNDLVQIRRRVLECWELVDLAAQRKSVIVPSMPAWNRPTPAAFMLNQIGETLARLFKAGMYVYRPYIDTFKRPKCWQKKGVNDASANPADPAT